MVQPISPKDAQALVHDGAVDIIDVRDHREWLTGHVPGARLIPLAEFRQNPRAHVKTDAVLFVCAAGVRSQLAAQLAMSAGLKQAYNLTGGTKAWTNAGLEIVHPSVPSVRKTG